MDAPASWFSLRYLERFRCLGADCPDDCCHGWTVEVDDKGAERLRAAVDAGELPAPSEGLVIERDHPERGRTTALRLVGDEKRCVLFGEDRLCTLQSRLGEAALPLGCATFPRSPDRVGDVVEVTASLGCPEVARLALLYDGGAEVVEISREQLPRPEIRSALDPAHPYARTFVDVRGLLLQLSRAEALPLWGRLAVMAQFCHDTQPFYRHDLVDGERLDGYVAELLRPDAMRAVVARAAKAPDDEPFAAFLVLATLGVRHLPDVSPAFRRVTSRVLAALDLATEPTADGKPTAEQVQRALDAFRTQRGQLAAHEAARIDEILARFVEHYWMSNWYVRSKSLWEHAFGLFLRVAVIRFLLICHPGLRLAPDARTRAATLDDAAVEIVYLFSRALDHNATRFALVLDPVAEARLNALPHAIALTRL